MKLKFNLQVTPISWKATLGQQLYFPSPAAPYHTLPHAYRDVAGFHCAALTSTLTNSKKLSAGRKNAKN